MDNSTKYIDELNNQLEKTRKEIESLKKIAEIMGEMNAKQMTSEGKSLFIKILKAAGFYTGDPPSSNAYDR